MTGPSYPAARSVAPTVQAHFARHHAAARQQSQRELAPQPDALAIETIIDVACWASLRHEEGYAPKISLAFLPPAQAGQPLMFDHHLPLTPHALARLAPAVERPSIHLGVWRDANEQLCVWVMADVIPMY